MDKACADERESVLPCLEETRSSYFAACLKRSANARSRKLGARNCWPEAKTGFSRSRKGNRKRTSLILVRSADQSLTRSQSLPQEVTQPLRAGVNEPLPVQHAETAARPAKDQPMSPPPNTLWNTPRASDRNRSGDEAAQTFTASAEEQKMANWAKYDEQAAELISKADNRAKRRQVSWDQATAAAVQTTHLMRLSAAVLLIMTLRAAKSLIYGGTDIAGWQRALTHVYAVPPLVLLTLLQLSAIFLFARMYHDTPSTIPSKVMGRVTAHTDNETGNLLSLVKKVTMVLAPSLLTLYQQISVARSAAKAVLDGTCVFLFAGMLCYQINEC
ncbi:hypothetical protein WJX79_007562 [Trebouxia sp. C0005]